MRLHLLRHGQTHANVSGALDTAVPGRDLTELGQAQARAASGPLGERGLDAIHVSRLVRTHQTAAPTAQALSLTLTITPGLEEIGAGDLEMSTVPADAKTYLTTVAGWIEGDLDRRMPGGESGHEFLDRYNAAIASIAASGATSALVVSHGAAIRAWTTLRTRGAGERWHDPLHNTACITVTDSDAGWDLVDWHTHAIGGHLLEDASATDPTGHAPE